VKIIFPQCDDSVGNRNALFYNYSLISVCVSKLAEIVVAIITPNGGRGKYFRFLDSFVQSQKSPIPFSYVSLSDRPSVRRRV